MYKPVDWAQGPSHWTSPTTKWKSTNSSEDWLVVELVESLTVDELELLSEQVQRLRHKVVIKGVPSPNSFHIRYPQPEGTHQIVFD